MRRVLFFVITALFFNETALATIIDSPVFINEFHYDNVGADHGEFVEVVASSSLTDLASVTLTLYNGTQGASYAGPVSLEAFTRGDIVDGYVFYVLELPMQNGAPDGLALALGNGVLQFLSYEGTFQATDGIAVGLTSTDVKVAEDSTTPLDFSLQLAGHGDSYSDFVWRAAAPHTRANVNHDQSFTVPEPSSLVAWLCAAGALFLGNRWRPMLR